MLSGYKLIGGVDIGANFKSAIPAYGAGTTYYRVAGVDLGSAYLKKATVNLSSTDTAAFTGGQYFDGGAVDLNSKFAHYQCRPIGAASGGTTQTLTNTSGTFNVASYGNSKLYNVLLVGAGGSGGAGVNGGSGGGGGGGGGAICITGLNIQGLTYAVGSSNSTCGAAIAYAGGAGADNGAGGAGGGFTAGGYSSAGAITGGNGGNGVASTSAGGTGASCSASNYYVDWTSVSLQYLAGGSGAAGMPGGTYWFPPAFGHPGFYYTVYGGGGGGGGANGSAVYSAAGANYGGGGAGQIGGWGGGAYGNPAGGVGLLYIMWSNNQ